LGTTFRNTASGTVEQVLGTVSKASGPVSGPLGEGAGVAVGSVAVGSEAGSEVDSDGSEFGSTVWAGAGRGDSETAWPEPPIIGATKNTAPAAKPKPVTATARALGLGHREDVGGSGGE
jgi:hypothetical protein